MNELLLWAILAVGVLSAGLLIWVVLQRSAVRDQAEKEQLSRQAAQQALLALVTGSSERLERELRREISDSARGGRQELTHNLATFQQTLVEQGAQATRTQNSQIDAFGQQLALLQKTLSDTLITQLSGVSESNARRLNEIRETLEKQLAQLQVSNAAKLDEMRATVDEKLQSTLQTRLGESFKQVADRLEQVHKGLGEMQTLAQGVGDLKHLLTNVKTRGIFGEAQLASLLEQVLVVDQYAAQVATRPGSKNVVDFAIKLPGTSSHGDPLWLPIDAKFPNEDYERLLDAQGRADVLGAEAAGKALELRIRLEAKSIADKYVEPPHTTDFAILFLPTEGLYAEVLRRPGLMQALQREHRITLAGPTTLLAMLSSLQMGFRTLALEKRSSEVWQVLGAVKTEFGKFGDVLAKVKSQTETVLKTLDSAQTRSRAMGRALKQVEALPEPQVPTLILIDPDVDRDAALDQV
ncbi:MAG: DNA recombination protein RmuC [Gammaproteobacteria bacterium]|uniref:DNA recombination protein RmuC n=1 Tax=Rhodoferax sp. TaxID=50421 RepID=UPI001857A58D|nr:DNA recombination protein RmuC [Rhodoferax sp.]MBU3899488.1 DNA recombination protein RmuC [Gammaproteobacteria bacterium]MBA3059558.1 DNA recombination protein RmuC [Rhodoferax sp.]MBU3998699.1 DNA recombination protein RmuC [Gammaproteobacteria bacterium]MBU4017964.1 DNA recombination protein RmuC [Gammaproteobacteria bacterium]MBU4080346.1 DNA recombination protein RmuC [Gammaproteobacteria bacterium]